MPRDFLIPFRKGRQWGYCDKRKNVVLEPKYSYCGPFNDGLAAVAHLTRPGIGFGYIDQTGREVIPLIYEGASAFCEGRAIVEADYLHGFIDTAGSPITSIKYSYAKHFRYGLARVCADSKVGFIDLEGNEAVPLVYEWPGPTDEEAARLVWGADFVAPVDEYGVIPSCYDNYQEAKFCEGLARVSLAEKWGFIDTSGRIVIPLQYDQAWDFREGRAHVTRYYKHGFIDRQGQEVVPLKYESVGDFHNGLAGIGTFAHKNGFIGLDGTEYWEDLPAWDEQWALVWLRRASLENEVMPLQYHTYTESGQVHTNEDCALVQPHPKDNRVLLCALADGQGGRAGGREAAQIAVQESLAYLTQQQLPNDLVEVYGWFIAAAGADEAVSRDAEAGFTTLILCGVTTAGVAGVSGGDSAAVFWDGSKMLVLTEEQRKNPPVGSGSAALTPFALRSAPPWKLLLMSDGVWKYAGWAAVEDALKTLPGEPLLLHLRDLVKRRNGGILPDDFTAVLVEA